MSSTVTADDLDYVEIDRPLVELAINALASAERNALRVVTAESCTGGLIATARSASEWASAPFAMAMATCLLTTPSRSMSFGSTPKAAHLWSAV